MRIYFSRFFGGLLYIFFVLPLGCTEASVKKPEAFFEARPNFIADSFDFPVGKPNAQGYYNAQKFGANNHLGDDWNGVNGGDTDLGDPIYAIGNGYVKAAYDHKLGWGKVIRIVHYRPGKNPEFIESLYAHCDELLVKAGDKVKKGQKIGTIGTADGRYVAHLHLEIRDNINMPVKEGYSKNQTGYLNPTAFIQAHR